MSIATAEHRLARVDRISRESECVTSFQLSLLDGEMFPDWDPGAHVSINFPNGLMRQYSLCGSRSDRSTITIAVLLDPNSRGGSKYLHENVDVGDHWEIGAIRNNFELVDAAEYIFVGGGIGITPMIPMIEKIHADGKPWRLVYGGRSRASMAYTTRLASYGANVAIKPQDEYGLLNFAADVTDGLSPGGVVYACGPEMMLNALDEHCRTHDVPLHVERFRASEEVLIGSGMNREFVCELRVRGTEIRVGADETIIQAFEREGIFVKSDCREGTCGSCETTVIAGTVEHRDALLDEDERVDSKTMMICVSRATSERLTLKI